MSPECSSEIVTSREQILLDARAQSLSRVIWSDGKRIRGLGTYAKKSTVGKAVLVLAGTGEKSGNLPNKATRHAP